MRYRMIALSMLACAATYANAQQVSIHLGQPNVSIGINLPVYPEFERVPGYPVYYAPRVNSNVFFYDGLYWVYQEDRWYASSWYNGPWAMVEPHGVPLYVLRVPVRYYRQPPTYFRAWSVDAPPRWGEHWGPTWEQRRSGWDRWNRNAMPAAAPLPVYQKQYTGDRYPRFEQQQVLQSQQYRYQPRDTTVRQYYRQLAVPTTTAQKRQVTQAQSQSSSASAYAPGQMRTQQEGQSAKDFAPGQVKKREGAQSAKEFAPGQVKKQQQEAARTAYVPPQAQPETRPQGQQNRGRGKDKHDDDGNGQGQGQGQGKVKVKKDKD